MVTVTYYPAWWSSGHRDIQAHVIWVLPLHLTIILYLGLIYIHVPGLICTTIRVLNIIDMNNFTFCPSSPSLPPPSLPLSSFPPSLPSSLLPSLPAPSPSFPPSIPPSFPPSLPPSLLPSRKQYCYATQEAASQDEKVCTIHVHTTTMNTMHFKVSVEFRPLPS